MQMQSCHCWYWWWKCKYQVGKYTCKNNILLAGDIPSTYRLSSRPAYIKQNFKWPVCVFIYTNMCNCVMQLALFTLTKVQNIFKMLDISIHCMSFDLSSCLNICLAYFWAHRLLLLLFTINKSKNDILSASTPNTCVCKSKTKSRCMLPQACNTNKNKTIKCQLKYTWSRQ